MTTKYFAILTNQGAARLANATALGTKLNITQMAVGDANGKLPTPDPAQTKLINQTRIAALNSLKVDANDAGQIIAEQIIPENEGGFFIREIGLFDDTGTLVAVANCPETYKPLLAEGSGRTQTIRMILVVSSTAAITLKIDPSVVLATRQYVDDAVIEVKAYADKLMKNHEAKANPHTQYPLTSNALKELVDAGLVDKALKNLGIDGAILFRGNIPANTTLNQLSPVTQQGRWSQTTTTGATIANGYPEDNCTGICDVIGGGAYGGTQVFFCRSGNIYIRSLTAKWNGSDGLWSDWVNASTSNIRNIPADAVNMCDPRYFYGQHVYTINVAMPDMPVGLAVNNASVLVSYKRNYAAGAAIAQYLHASGGKVYYRCGNLTGSNSAWTGVTWQGGDANGWKEVVTSDTLAALGINTTTMPVLSKIDWQKVDIISGAQYVWDCSSWVNAPAGLPTASIAVIEISGRGTTRAKIELTALNSASNRRKYTISVDSVGTPGSRTFDVIEIMTSGNPTPVSAGGTGDTTPAGALKNLGGAPANNPVFTGAATIPEVKGSTKFGGGIDVSNSIKLGYRLLMTRQSAGLFSYQTFTRLDVPTAPTTNTEKGQARTLGDNTAASADDAAAAQIIVAKSGADKDGILAQTPAILNMSLANKETMEDNAKLLIGTKSAFGLSDDKATHIADVISMTMNKSQATFAGLSDSLTYVAPVAKNAGVSLEETAAMIGSLHDANITGSMAGTGSRAVLSRLQAPTGKAHDAIKELGVKTMDSKGNTRPIFSILKEIQASFEKNNLGTGQRSEYMKAIFGEEASSSASVLMAAAASGKLDSLTRLIKDSDGKTEELVRVMQDNLGGDFKEFQSAYEAVGTDLYDQQEESLRSLTQTATKYVLRLDGWIQKNKGLAQTIGVIAGGALALIAVIGGIGLVAWPVIAGINAIIAAAGVMGTAFSIAGSAIATALGAITLPVVAVGVAIVAGALLIRKYWEPISAFLGGVVEGVISALAPVGEMFAPLTPMFNVLVEKVRGVWQWFKELIAPVKSTQETLDGCKNTGVAFGQALATALMAPLTAFNKLRSGIDWVLEKMGLINKESQNLDQTAAKTNAATQGNAYSPAQMPLSGYQRYQPVTAPAGRSYIDQSRSEYHVTLQGGVAPGGQLDNQLREAVERLEREKRAKARASMMHD